MDKLDIMNFGINWAKAVEYLDKEDIKEIKQLGFNVDRLNDLHMFYTESLCNLP